MKSSTWEVHAEIQLLPHYIRAPVNNEAVVSYIGCSKHSCFLCSHFLDAFAAIRTPGCHGKLYNLWGLPSFGAISTASAAKVVTSVRELEAVIEREILNKATEFVPPAKESTIGPSSIHTAVPVYDQPSLSRRVLEYLQNQRAKSVVSDVEF